MMVELLYAIMEAMISLQLTKLSFMYQQKMASKIALVINLLNLRF